MNLKEINVAVNIRDNNIHVVRGIIKNDTGNILNLKLIDGTDAFDFTGYGSIVMNLLKPDGTFIVDGTGPHLTEADTNTLADVADDEDNDAMAAAVQSLELINDNSHLQVVDAEHGMISIKLDYTQAVVLTGMHFITISLYAPTETDTTTGNSDVVKVTTARVNYYVEENIDQVDDGEVKSTNYFPILDQMLATCAGIYTNEYGATGRVAAETARKTAEAGRVAAETARVAAETARVAENTGIVAQAQAYKEAAEDILEVMERIIHGEISDYDDLAPVALQSDVSSAIATALATIDGTESTLKVNRGAAEDMTAALGELYYCTDTEKLWIGVSSNEQICINPDPESEIVISSEAPEDTTKVWIDTGNGNAIKIYDENEAGWVGTATATFG